MGGYLVNLFKAASANISDFANVDELNNQVENTDVVRNVVWSNFDRVEVRRIERFENYRNAENSEKYWIGERQSALLYDLVNAEDSRLIYNKSVENTEKCLFPFEPKIKKLYSEDKDGYRFYGITMIHFSQEMHYYMFKSQNKGKKFHEKLDSIIQDIIGLNQGLFSYLEYEIYGTLGSPGCAIVWLANQITDVLQILEIFRKVKTTSNQSIISNAYTIPGIVDSRADDHLFEDCNGIFNIRIIKRSDCDEIKLMDKIKECLHNPEKMKVVLGKYDANISFKCNNLKKNLYSEKNLLHFRNEVYRKNCLEVYTEVMQEMNVLNYSIPTNIKISVSEEMLFKLESSYFTDVKKEIDKILRYKIFDKYEYLKDTFWLLYQDYVKNMSSSFSYPWLTDLQYSFLESLKCLNSTLEYYGNERKENYIKINVIEFFINTIRETILHISQANRFYFEIPNSHLKQSGAYSKIIRAYYGIIKTLLNIGYALPRFQSQSEIIPFITIDVQPKVESNFFETFAKDEKRIVNFKLPYEALTNMPKFSKLMAHEIFHYITPVNRKIRNYFFGCIIVCEYLNNFTYLWLSSLYSNKNVYSYQEWQKHCGVLLAQCRIKLWNEVLDCYDQLTSGTVKREDMLYDEYVKVLKQEVIYENMQKLTQMQIWSPLIHASIVNPLLAINPIDEVDRDIVLALERYRDEKIFFQDMHDWILATNPCNNVLGIDCHITKAMREALADWFMIQSMNMDENAYIKLIFDYIKRYESANESEDTDKFAVTETSMTESFRIGMVLSYIWKNNGEWYEEDIQKLNLTEKQEILLKDILDKYDKFAKLYSKVYYYFFETIDFEKVNRDSDTWKKYLENVKKIRVDDDKNNFDYNISIIMNMQYQESLKNVFAKKDVNTSNDTIDEIKKKFYLKDSEINIKNVDISENFQPVNSLEEFMRAFSRIQSVLSRNGKDILWFRGHAKSERLLIPTLYRIKNKKNKAYQKSSLRVVAENYTSAFRLKSFSAPEIESDGNQSYICSLVSMQHYEIETNLLDWSEQILSSLYFAIKDYIKNPNKKEKPEADARIYILNPIHMNEVMREQYKIPIDTNHYGIPFMLEDEKKYKNYLPFMLEDKKKYKSYFPFSLWSRKSKENENRYYPFAIYTPYVNKRIKLQNGCFVIFGLDNTNAEGDYTQFDLEKIQSQYKQDMEEKKKLENYWPFLGHIDISKDYIQKVADEIRIMGITEDHIYPELEHIANRIKRELKNSYNED